MAEKKKQSAWKTLLAVGGLTWGAYGIYKYATRASNPNPPPIIVTGDGELITAESDKIKSFADYHRQVYGGDGTRTPTELEIKSLGMLASAMQSEEDDWHFHDPPSYRTAITQFYKSHLGIDVILPILAGFIAVGGMVTWDRYYRPEPPPVECPACAAYLANPEAAVAHVTNAHTMNTDPAAMAEAEQQWAQQPYWTMTATGAIGGAYNAAYQPVSSWSLGAMTRNVQGMVYSLSMGIGTVGTLAALQQTLVYCLI